MPNYPMYLAKRCDVCGGKITNVSAALAMAAVANNGDRYMCETCKAVYSSAGVRDLTYPTIYDDPQAGFDQLHTPTLRLKQAGLNPADVIQVKVPTFGWQYAQAQDFDVNTRALMAQLPGQIARWYQPSEWRDAKQALPSPVLAPPSMAPLARKPRKAKGLAIIPPAPVKVNDVKVWTYDTRTQSPIFTLVPETLFRDDKVTALAPVKGQSRRKTVSMALKVLQSSTGNWHAFEATTGALVMTAANSSEVIRNLEADLSNTDRNALRDQLLQAANIREQALFVPVNEFFNRQFVS